MVVEPPGAVQIIPPNDHATKEQASRPRSFTASEPEYFEQLEQRRPGLSRQIQAFLADIGDLGVIPEFRRSLVLRWEASPDETGSPGSITNIGKVWFSSAWSTAKRLGNPEAGEKYLESVAGIVQGTVKRGKSWPEVLGPDGRLVDVAELLKSSEQWKVAIGRLIDETRPT